MASTQKALVESLVSATHQVDKSRLFSSDAVLDLLQLIFEGAPLPEVLTVIARIVESAGDGTFCTIWLPTETGTKLHCVAAPSLPGFIERAGAMEIGPAGGSCGAAVYRKEPVYVTDVLTDPIWDQYRDRLLPFGLRAVWSQPLFKSDDKILGTFAIHYREVRSPTAADRQLIENAGHLARVAIERHLNEEALRLERDRLRLLLKITNSLSSNLDPRRLIETLSTDLLSVLRCDVCALLLPDNSRRFSVKPLYNPDPRGALVEGTILRNDYPLYADVFLSGKARVFHASSEAGDTVGAPDRVLTYRQFLDEGVVSGWGLPLLGRSGVIGVFAVLNRSPKAFDPCQLSFLEQVAGQIAIAVENALEYQRAIGDRDKEAKRRLYFEEEVRAEFGEIIGDSSALRSSLDLVSVVAPTDSSVLLLGETGTGKELIARAIHKLSSRRDQAFVKLNCAAIPLGLLESELFGHERGAFTGAISQKTGRFELAHRGTLFLDEVGDIPLELQAKLLRVLQEQEFERLGSNHTHKVDVRMIAATHRDLSAMVKQKSFREDLFYRLKVFPISIPPLRKRAEDIPKLVWHFTQFHARRMNKTISGIPPETMQALAAYPWPGNVRELQNFIERAVILTPNTVLRAPIAELNSLNSQVTIAAPISGLEEVERDHIVRALEASKWVVGGRNGAAERLGMKRTSLVYKMQKLRIHRPTSTR
jgi:formate hydrogenlyase transcriptional activator